MAGVRREDHYPEFRIGRIKHERVRVHRSDEHIYEEATRVMRFHASRKAILEIEFADEEGTGLGVTMEFYALASAEFQRKSRAMWLCDDDDEAERRMEAEELDLGEGVKPPGYVSSQSIALINYNSCSYYVRRQGGLFPSPAPPGSAESARMSEAFRVLGIFLAKVLQDGRLVDLPLSLAFLQLITADSVTANTAGSDEGDAASNSTVLLDGVLGIGDLDEVHPHKARFLRALQRLCIEKATIRAITTLTTAARHRRIADLRLRFQADDDQHEHECRM